MRHRYDRVHLNRTSAHRKALAMNLAISLFANRRIITTLAKARFARRFAERMITFARRGDLHARRHVLRHIPNRAAVHSLFADLGPHFLNRNGGYTRIVKLGIRRSDAAPMAMLELVGFADIAEQSESKPAGKSRLKEAQRSKSAELAKADATSTGD